MYVCISKIQHPKLCNVSTIILRDSPQSIQHLCRYLRLPLRRKCCRVVAAAKATAACAAAVKRPSAQRVGQF